MTTNYETDSSTQTIAAAWASSALGQPEREVRYGFAPGPDESATDDHPSDAKRAVLAAALACGVIGGASLGVMLFDYTDAAQPSFVVPRSEGPLPVAPPSQPTETRPVNVSDPNPVAPELKTASDPVTAAPPSGPGAADVGTPPVGADGDTTVVVDIPIPDDPPLPEKPADDADDPEPPDPDPPVLDDPTFTLPEPPEPEPDPDPPTFVADLPLAPLPDPDPVLELPLAPSAQLNPQPEPPSMPNFVPPVGFRS
jgi:hypothetical protein